MARPRHHRRVCRIIIGKRGSPLGPQSAAVPTAVPFLLSVPWLAHRERSIDGVFGHADLVPALLGLAGLPLPSALQGESLWPAR